MYPGIKPGSPSLQADSLPSEPQGSNMSKDEMAWHMRGAVRSLEGFEGLEIEFKPHGIISDLQLITHYYFVRLIW